MSLLTAVQHQKKLNANVLLSKTKKYYVAYVLFLTNNIFFKKNAIAGKFEKKCCNICKNFLIKQNTS